MRRSAPLAAFACVLALAGAPTAIAQSVPSGERGGDAVFRATTLNLGAFGETRVRPDMATISLGVTTEAATAAAAMSEAGRSMSAVLAALKRGGIAERDIQTSQMSLEPQYAYEQNQPPRLTGYRAAEQLTVTVRELSRLGGAVDAVVGAGANQVGSISFGLADATAAENAARELAVRALAAKADLYAKATGYRVLRLVSLSESGASAPPPPVPMVAMTARFQKGETPVAPGEVRVRVDVSGVYELGR